MALGDEQIIKENIAFALRVNSGDEDIREIPVVFIRAAGTDESFPHLNADFKNQNFLNFHQEFHGILTSW